MNVFISGGCKNGKSYFAQRLAADMAGEGSGEGGGKRPLYYVATMRPVDEEDKSRIKRHVAEREGWGFLTLEQSENICDCLSGVDADGVFLLDSVTALLSNEMFRQDGTVDFSSPQRVGAELSRFASLTGRAVFVSDYIYSDAMQYEELTEAYRKGLAHIDRTLAKLCGRVAQVAYGTIDWLK